jgi:hypothetical protein
MSVDRGVPTRHALAVDFGTSYTVATARWPDGRARAILVDGSPLLPSAVYLEPDGHLVAGRDAVYSARLGASARPSEAAGLNRVPSAAGRAEPPMPEPVDPRRS